MDPLQWQKVARTELRVQFARPPRGARLTSTVDQDYPKALRACTQAEVDFEAQRWRLQQQPLRMNQQEPMPVNSLPRIFVNYRLVLPQISNLSIGILQMKSEVGRLQTENARLQEHNARLQMENERLKVRR